MSARNGWVSLPFSDATLVAPLDDVKESFTTRAYRGARRQDLDERYRQRARQPVPIMDLQGYLRGNIRHGQAQSGAGAEPQRCRHGLVVDEVLD